MSAVRLQRLIDALVEDVLSMTDEELLLEAFENGEDTAAEAEKMRAEIRAAVLKWERKR